MRLPTLRYPVAPKGPVFVVYEAAFTWRWIGPRHSATRSIPGLPLADGVAEFAERDFVGFAGPECAGDGEQ